MIIYTTIYSVFGLTGFFLYEIFDIPLSLAILVSLAPFEFPISLIIYASIRGRYSASEEENRGKSVVTKKDVNS